MLSHLALFMDYMMVYKCTECPLGLLDSNWTATCMYFRESVSKTRPGVMCSLVHVSCLHQSAQFKENKFFFWRFKWYNRVLHKKINLCAPCMPNMVSFPWEFLENFVRSAFFSSLDSKNIYGWFDPSRCLGGSAAEPDRKSGTIGWEIVDSIC